MGKSMYDVLAEASGDPAGVPPLRVQGKSLAGSYEGWSMVYDSKNNPIALFASVAQAERYVMTRNAHW